MKTELKEKMQKEASEEFSHESFYKRIELRDAYILGAEAMYAELVSLVKWVSVEERMPYSDGYYLTKNEKEISLLFFSTFLQKFSEYTTYWRRIEL